MGLDCMPQTYPCQKTNKWVATGEDKDVIDCKATIEANACPYKKANPPEEGGAVGIFGAPCWYRGKYGNRLVEELGLYDEAESMSFYGDDKDGEYKNPDSCRKLATAMEEALEQHGLPYLAGNDKVDITHDIRFAVWYLRWVAEEGDGINAWW